MKRFKMITTLTCLIAMALMILIMFTYVLFIYLLHTIVRQIFICIVYEIALFIKLVKYGLPFRLIKEILSAYDTRLGHVFILNYFPKVHYMVFYKKLSNTFD